MPSPPLQLEASSGAEVLTLLRVVRGDLPPPHGDQSRELALTTLAPDGTDVARRYTQAEHRNWQTRNAPQLETFFAPTWCHSGNFHSGPQVLERGVNAGALKIPHPVPCRLRVQGVSET